MSDELDEPFELIEVSRIQAFGNSLLAELGVPAHDSELLIDTLIQAEMWGHSSHGLLRLSWYLDRLASGAMKPVAAPQHVIDSGPILVIDGQDGIGQVLATYASEKAIKRAREFGVSAVGIRNSNHFGTAMYFTRNIAKQNCVAILTTNASPSMAPWGGAKKILGNNPWSIAAPFRDSVVALDMANTVVARGKIYAAKERNEIIPDTWAITKDGRRTTNPAEAIEGVILPMGEHKGYAISFMMDVLSGALTGGGVATEVHGPYEAKAKSNSAHFLLVIDVEKFAGTENFQQRLETLVADVKSAPLAEGFSKIFYPGEIEDAKKVAAEKTKSIKVYQSTAKALNDFALGMELPKL